LTGPRTGVVILTARHETNYALVRALASSVGVDHVVFEDFRTWRMIPYRLKKLGWLAVAGQLLFLAWDFVFDRPRARTEIGKLLEGYDVSPPDGSLPTTDVARINAPEVEALLRELQPRVVVVYGTGIIAKRILALAPTFINIHAGITPRYRGVHGGFWAIYEGRPELAGVTVHLVDPGVDTGAILRQQTIEVDPARDSYRTLPVKQALAGIPLVIGSVRDALEGHLSPYQRDDLPSKQWFTPTLREYRQFRRQMRALAR
jgi:phosphoribosylglycinamide formyltransferase-1